MRDQPARQRLLSPSSARSLVLRLHLASRSLSTVACSQVYREEFESGVVAVGSTKIIVAAVVATVTAVIGPAASAATGPFDVTALKFDNIRVASNACRYTDGVASHNATGPGTWDIDVDVEVWRGSTYIDSAWLFDDAPGEVTGDYLWCPFEGLGTFRVGPSQVSWWWEDADFNFDYGNFTDSTTGSFTARQVSGISLAIARSGSRLTHSVLLRRYSVSASSWVRWRYKTVSIQRRTADGWVTIARPETNRFGRATVVRYSSAKRTYRATVGGISTTWGDASPLVSK